MFLTCLRTSGPDLGDYRNQSMATTRELVCVWPPVSLWGGAMIERWRGWERTPFAHTTFGGKVGEVVPGKSSGFLSATPSMPSRNSCSASRMKNIRVSRYSLYMSCVRAIFSAILLRVLLPVLLTSFRNARLRCLARPIDVTCTGDLRWGRVLPEKPEAISQVER